MTPRIDPTLSPPFSEMGDEKFQRFCADLMAEDVNYKHPEVYGRSGQSQRGVDILAELRDGTGLDVGQCKAWKAPSATEIHQATEDFLPHIQFWKEQRLKKFILIIGCTLEDTKSQDQLRVELARFRALGFGYEWWDAQTLRRKLQPFPHIVSDYCVPPNYWVEVICGKSATGVEGLGAGLKAIATPQEVLVLELSDSRNEQLDAIRTLWDEGSTRDAFNRLRELRQTKSWPSIKTEVQAKALRMQAVLTLGISGDVHESRELVQMAKALEPNNCSAVEALVVSRETGVMEALHLLESPTTPDTWNVRLRLLMQLGKPEKVLAEMPLIPKTSRTPDIAWAEGMALLCLRRIDEARRVLETALSSRPRSFGLQMAVASVHYACGISAVFDCWAHLSWPIPPPWPFVKRDDESQRQRSRAAEEFKQLSTKCEGDARREILVWRLACLATDSNQQTEAGQLCAKLLGESPGYVPAVLWALERGFEFDRTRCISNLRDRVVAANPKPEEVVVLSVLVAEIEGPAAAEAVLDSCRAVFEAAHQMSSWRAHKAQLAVVLGDNATALKFADEETDPLLKHHVRQAAMGAIARHGGDRNALAMDHEAEFNETGDANALLFGCMARQTTGDWAFIADHAEQLVALVGTEYALRISATGSVNARRPDLSLKLLNENMALCPGSALPPDLERVRGEALRQQGKLGKAVEAVEKAAQSSPDLNTLIHLFRLQKLKGDILGGVETAKKFVSLEGVPAQFIAEEVAPAIRRVAPELTRKLVHQAKQSLPQDSPALLLVAEQASKVGLTDLAHEVFAKMPLWAEKGVQGIEAYDMERMLSLMKDRAKSLEQALQDYRRGIVPVHILAIHFNVLLGRWFFAAPRTSMEAEYLESGFPLLIRHGALANEKPAHLDTTQELFLDITSLLLLRSLNLLDTVESSFPRIVVSARTTAWLQAETDQLQTQQPDYVEAQEQAIGLFEAGKLHGCSGSTDFCMPTGEWADQMGRAWCERLWTAQVNGGFLVAFLPLRSPIPPMPIVQLPPKEESHVIGMANVIDSLETGGRISGDLAAKARDALGVGKQGNRLAPKIEFPANLEIHLDIGIAEQLALGGVLKPLIEATRVFVVQEEVDEWRDQQKLRKTNAALLAELEGLLGHLSEQFGTEHYRIYECPSPHVPKDVTRPLSDRELCFQDSLYYALKCGGIWCINDRSLRGLRRENAQPSADVYDLVHHLHRTNIINDDEFYDRLIVLRAANLRYLPLAEGEILHHLRRAPIQDEEVVETPALKTIRRSVAAALLDKDWLQRPQSTPDGRRFLMECEIPARLYLAAAHATVAVWTEKESSAEACAARSTWLWDNLMVDLRLMQQVAGPNIVGLSALDASGQSFAVQFSHGMAIEAGHQGKMRAAYFNWLYDYCVLPLLPNNPEIVASIAAALRRVVEHTLIALDTDERISGNKSPAFISRLLLMAHFLSDLPVSLQNALKLTDAELKRLSLHPAVTSLNICGVALNPNEFWSAIVRVLDCGYAAILKPGTRLQFSVEKTTGMVLVRRRGNCSMDGGYVDDPFLYLLHGSRTKRMAALQSGCCWLDLNTAERQVLFDKLVAITEPVERKQQLDLHLENSASWFYFQFERRLKARVPGPMHLDVAELLPQSLGSLSHHLRLESTSNTGADVEWQDSVRILLENEGIEETLVRISCLPVRLPETVFRAVELLDRTGRASLFARLGHRIQSPLQRLQLVLLALKYGADLPQSVAQAKSDIKKLLDPVPAVATAETLVALFQWTALRLGWLRESCGWSLTKRLRVAWAHAGRLHSALLASRVSNPQFREWLSGNTHEMSRDGIGSSREFSCDAASPIGITGMALLLSALSDFAAQLPEDVLDSLEMPALLKQQAEGTPHKRPFLLVSQWHEVSLKTNVLGSFLGEKNEVGLRRLFGDEAFDYLSATPALKACEDALGQLSTNPCESKAWTILHLATNEAALPPPLALKLDCVIQQIPLLEVTEKDVALAEKLILYASGFAMRGRPASVSEKLLDQLFSLAEHSSRRFRGQDVALGAENAVSRLGAALVQGVWECSIISGDASGTVAQYVKNLSLLIRKWPAIGRVAQYSITSVLQRLPVVYQDAIWTGLLTCRAWS
jgi:tetratricopeptide (TPR) repeat protein